MSARASPNASMESSISMSNSTTRSFPGMEYTPLGRVTKKAAQGGRCGATVMHLGSIGTKHSRSWSGHSVPNTYTSRRGYESKTAAGARCVRRLLLLLLLLLLRPSPAYLLCGASETELRFVRRDNLAKFEQTLLKNSRSYRTFEQSDRLDSPRDDGLEEQLEMLIQVRTRNGCFPLRHQEY